MATLDLYIDTARRCFVAGPLNTSVQSPPSFSQGNTVTLRIRCLNPTANFPLGSPPYSLVDVSGKTLQLALGTKSGTSSTHYTELYSWSTSTDPADPYFYGDLPMNTAGISTLLGNSTDAKTYLEINLLVSGVPSTVFSDQVTVSASVIKNSTLTVPIGLTPLSAEAAAATYLSREITGPFTLISADGTKKVSVYVGTDGTFHADPLT